MALFKDNDILHQVLCWGVRDMKHYLLLPVDSPLVEVECGGVVQHSQHIEDTRKNPNFPDPLIHFEVVSVIKIICIHNSKNLIMETFLDFIHTCIFLCSICRVKGSTPLH